MFLRLFKFYVVLSFLVIGINSCGREDATNNPYTTILNGYVEDSEIRQLNELFSCFEEKMKATYNCKTRKKCLHFMVSEYERMIYDDIFIPTPQEREIINQYKKSPSFSTQWVQLDNYYEGIYVNRTIFVPYQPYETCLTKENKILASIYRKFSMMGDYNTYLYADHIRWELDNQKNKLNSSFGLAIFLQVYLVGILNNTPIN